MVHKKLNVCHCPICNQLSSKKNLRRHIRNVHERENFKCDLCNRCYFKEQMLKRHKAIAHNKKTNFKCEICNFNFTQKDNLDTHVKSVHEKIREHVCEVCNRAFLFRYKLKRHMNALHKNATSI